MTTCRIIMRTQNLHINAFTHLRIHSFTHSLIYSFTHLRIYAYLFLLLLPFFFGCPSPPQDTAPPAPRPRDVNIADSASVIIWDFAPAKVEIMPLTQITVTDDGRIGNLVVYLSLIDSFNCQQKWPAVFRFELYHRVFRAAEQKGKRVHIWPDIELTDPARNNKYWKDFLRAYQFNLNFTPAESADYVLLATCILPNQKRLSAELPLKATQSLPKPK